MNRNRVAPNIEYVPPEPWAIERLQRWCELWTLDRALTGEGASCVDDSSDKSDDHLVMPPRGLQKLEPGEVALLPPLGEDDPPLYLLILASPNAEWIDCIPFSRFPEPATPGELLSGLEPDALRVLCLWNARQQPRNHTPSGWPLAALPPSVTGRVQQALEEVRRSGRVPHGRTHEGGPPMTHPDDPRRAYLYAARHHVDRHFTPILLRYEPPPPDLRRAAEPPPDWPRE
jgi:hypothetical protein